MATRMPVDYYFPKSTYRKYIEDIMYVAQKNKDIKVIFKTHPHYGERDIILNILKKYDKNLWDLSNDHPFYLAKNADVCISFITSACFDFISLKKPTIEYFCPMTEAKRNKLATTSPHYVYNKKKWITIFDYLKVVIPVSDKIKLENLIVSILKNKTKKIWMKNYEYFKKYNNKYSSKNLQSILKKEIK